MKTDYFEKKEAKIERFQELAAKNEKKSIDLFNQSSKMADVIPFGQPILGGHHSEQRDRNYRAKIHNTMDQAVRTGDKAKYYEARAETLLNGTAISSDNPNAIELLNEKLEKLEALQTLYKAINKIIGSKKFNDIEKISQLSEIGVKEQMAVKLMDKTNFGGPGIPSFRLTNNNATIRNTRQRVEHLAKIESMESTEEEINGITLKINSEANRVQILFPFKPSEDTRTNLKRAGFHWSPSECAWQRQISNSAIWSAKDILKTAL